MPASTEFTKLKEQVEGADERIRASAAKGADELKAMVDEARTKADARADELSSKAREAGDTAEAHWNQVQSDWDRHIKQIRKRIDAKKAELDADVAERDARPRSRRPSTRCSTQYWPGKTRMSWRLPPSAVVTAPCPSRSDTGTRRPSRRFARAAARATAMPGLDSASRC